MPTPYGQAEEAELLTRLQATDERLDRWRLRAMQVEQPQVGSDLAGDDVVFPTFPISEVVRSSLISGGEHLRLARTAIEAKQLYPSAHFTVLRGALVGAAQGVWVASDGDSVERRERGLMVIGYMQHQMDRHYLAEDTGLDQEERQRLAGQRAWLATRQAQVQAARRSTRGFQQTSMIASAIDSTFTDAGDRHRGRMYWQRMSSDAHVLGWSLLQRSSPGPVDRATGLASFSGEGSLADIVPAFEYCYRLLRRGWSLFDQRCTAP